MITKEERAFFEEKLRRIHDQVQAMADEEARSALINGWAAQGGYVREKMRLIEDD